MGLQLTKVHENGLELPAEWNRPERRDPTYTGELETDNLSDPERGIERINERHLSWDGRGDSSRP